MNNMQVDIELDQEYEVNIGTSILNNVQDSEYYALRYNFMPDSIDLQKPGRLFSASNGETTVLLPNQQHEDWHSFKGKSTVNKEVDCILIFDPESQSFKLERQAGTLSLRNVRKEGKKIGAKPNMQVLHTPSAFAVSPRDNSDKMTQDDLLSLDNEIDQALNQN